MTLQTFESGSAANGRLAKGCELCAKGAKMVLFATGRCGAGCFYCPVSKERMNADAVYANEGRAYSDDDVILEAEAMDALGAGITGGDPSRDMDRTLHYVRLLREHFGRRFHIHMYTMAISLENALALQEAGLNEIRYHPPERMWTSMQDTELSEVAGKVRMDVGIEVPALPGSKEGLVALAEYAFSAGADFMNLNELEFSESNWVMMKERGYEVKGGLSAAIGGSEETALTVMRLLPDRRIHFCSSHFKDGVQLRNRLKRRAENTARPYDVVTDDGTFLRGIIYADDCGEAVRFMREEYDVPAKLISVDHDRDRVEIAPWILEEVGPELPFKCYIVEEYPTRDRLEVERTPMNRMENGRRASKGFDTPLNFGGQSTLRLCIS